MLTERRDYILRLIQQAGAAARRIRELLTGAATSTADLDRDADQAIAELLGGGAQAQLFERLDAATAVRLMADENRVQAWVELLRVKGDVLLRAGSAAAEAYHGRARALEVAAAQLHQSSGS